MQTHNDLNAEYWNDRYLTENFGWDAGEITKPLQDYFDQLTDKSISILIPGAGNAYEAEYLVNKGFEQVYVCDFAPTPLQSLKERCPQMSDQHLICCDFFELSSQHFPDVNKGFDLIIEQTFFCALIPSIRQSYFEKMRTLLKPGGKLVGLLFDDTLNANQPPFGGHKNEYPKYFDHLFTTKTYEKAYNSITPRKDREIFINLIRKN